MKNKRQQTKQMYIRYQISKNSLFVAIESDGVHQHATATCNAGGARKAKGA